MSNVLSPRRRISRILGRWRLFLGFCPRCNSDAPAVYDCRVCNQVYEDGENITSQNSRQCYPPNLATKALWWFRWVEPTFETRQRSWERMLEIKNDNRTQ